MKRTRGLWTSIVFVAILVVSSLAGFFTNSLKPVLGLDLEGGVSVILTAPPGTPSNVMQVALANIRNRVDAFGVGEPDIALTGTTIQVQVPGLTKSVIEARPKIQYCLIGPAGEVYACGTTQAAADAGLAALEVKGTPSNVCIVDKSGKQLKCYTSQTEADAALAGLTVAAKTPPTPKPSGSVSPIPTGSPKPTGSPSSAGPGAAPSAYCVNDSAGTQLACEPSQAKAQALQKTFKTSVEGSTYCVVDNGIAIANPTPTPTPNAVIRTPTPSPKPGKANHATPTPTPSVSASPSPAAPKPSAFATLDRKNADPLPCDFPSKGKAHDALDAITVTKETKIYCVVSTTKQLLGCFTSMAQAVDKQRLTSQGHLLDIIGKTARLEERPVLAVLSPGDPTPITCSKADPNLASGKCDKVGALDNTEVVYPDPRRGANVRLGPVVVDGGNIKKATAVFNPVSQTNSTPQWVVSFEMDSEGTAAFATASTLAYNYHQAGQSPLDQIAIAVDRSIISSPQVINPITDGKGEISGSFTQQSASDLATVLNAGALPVELTRKATQTVSPTLGKASLHQGIVAGLVGLGLLFLYLLFYYRLLGLVAWVGMLIWATLALALVSLAGTGLGYALTLAGVAGLIISLGVTADSYIVFFERLKDEVRNGKTPRSAVQPAFKRAFKTIVAADLVTMIAAVVLYLTAISSVRGFALTLFFATLLDLFVVYFFKRPTVFLIARNPKLVSLPGFGLESGVAAQATDGSQA